MADLRVAVPAIDIDIHRVDPPGEPPHLHLDVRFLVVAPSVRSKWRNEESLALRWVTEAELDGLGADDEHPSPGAPRPRRSPGDPPP